LLLNVVVHAQTESCAQYGDYPADFRGQKCWMAKYLKSHIWKYNNKQKVDVNFYFSISQEELDNYFVYNQGQDTFYLDTDNMAWGSFYYPCPRGGIASRYRTNTFPISTNLSWDAVKMMDSVRLFKLSPAEKLDILMGNKNFDVTKWELRNRGPERGNHGDDGYCGYCNGSRVAGALLPEPYHNVTISCMKDPDIKITFSPSDIKAIAAGSYMHPYFYLGIGSPDQAGQNDPNPALVDIMLRLYLAKHKMPFFIDAEPGPALYNETVLGYDRQITGRKDASNEEKINYPGASKTIAVKTILYLQDELTIDQSNAPTLPVLSDKKKAMAMASASATYNFWVHKLECQYFLFVDAQGTILNGKWIGRPVDFVWAANGAGNDENSEHAFNPGNKNIKFDPILLLVRQSLTRPGEGINAPLHRTTDPTLLNAGQIYQKPPTNLKIIQNTDKHN
jgi:hypothetical protein